jgi:hypothetical protein
MLVEISEILFCHIHLIHGARLLVVHGTDRADEHRNIHGFDSNPKGGADLPLSDEGDGGNREKGSVQTRTELCVQTDKPMESIGGSVVAVEPQMPQIVSLLSHPTVRDTVY